MIGLDKIFGNQDFFPGPNCLKFKQRPLNVGKSKETELSQDGLEPTRSLKSPSAASVLGGPKTFGRTKNLIAEEA